MAEKTMIEEEESGSSESEDTVVEHMLSQELRDVVKSHDSHQGVVMLIESYKKQNVDAFDSTQRMLSAVDKA